MHNQGAAEVNDKALIVDIVRAAGSHSGVNINPLLDNQEGSQPIRAGKVIKKWIDENRESIVGTRGGPFNPTDQYVTTYKNNKIYVHVLSWAGKNNIILPAIIDRMVKNAWAPRKSGSRWCLVGNRTPTSMGTFDCSPRRLSKWR